MRIPKRCSLTPRYKATDQLTFNTGVRYTDEHKDYTFSRKHAHGCGLSVPLGGDRRREERL